MKIALINTFYPPWNFGGDGVYIRRFARALARRGCEVSVLHDTETFEVLAPATPTDMLEPLEEPAGVRVTRLRSGLGAVSTLITHQTGRPLANSKALGAFFAQDFDVTHFHNVSAVGGPGIFSRGSGIKLYTAHEHWLVCPTHILWRYNREVCDARKCFSCQIENNRPPQLWRSTGFLKRQGKKIDRFITLSHSSAANHKRFGFPFEMSVLPSFLPDLEELPAPSPAPRPYALFVGRLEKIKGLQDVIPAIAADAPFDLVIVGEGDYAPELKRLAAGHPRIRFVGRMAPEEISALYAGALAAILPSLCLEVFPLVAIEALRAGAPVIARKHGPFPEIVDETGAGYLFEEPIEIVNHLERLAADPALRKRLGVTARSAFAARWSEKVALNAYFNLVGDVAAEKGLEETAAKARSLVETG